MAILDNSNTPIFVQNQILRADDLNAMVTYFEEQARLTRIFTIGIGIVNGLNLDYGESTITIHPGVAISSDGVLFEITTQRIFSFYKITNISKNAFHCVDGKRGSCSDDKEEKEIVYELLEVVDEPSPKMLADLIEEEMEKPHCVVMVYCEETISRKSCFNDCEQSGADRLSQVRILLVPESILGGDNNEETVNTVSQVNIESPPILHRFGYDGDGLNVCAIKTWEALYLEYRNRFSNAGVLLGIVDSYQSTYEGYVQKINSAEGANPFEDLSERLEQLNANYPAISIPGISDIQYCYAFFRDLILAYEEFFQVACAMSLGVNSETTGNGEDLRCSFPGHIVLGPFKPNNSGNETCQRTGFFSASAKEGKQDRQLRAERLYDRLLDLVKTVGNEAPSLDLQLNTGELIQQPVRITGSCTQKFNLSHQAVPFYLKLDNVKNNWRADNPHCDLSEMLTHYDRSILPHNVLLKKLDTFDFYRIEGHLGKALEGVLGEIETHRKKLNLSFDIRPLLIGPDIRFEDIFAGKELYFGEMQEVYQNTRADLLCKIEELTNPGENLQSLGSQLESIPELGQLSQDSIDTMYDLAQGPDNSLKSSFDLAQVILVELLEKYNGLMEDIKRSIQFHTFAEDHSGMEHLGGVHCGGTFILVYTYLFKSQEKKEDFARPLGIDNIDDLSDEQALLQLLAIIDGNQDPKTRLIQLKALNEILDKTVVADFCLPYLCCSTAPVIRNEFKQPSLQIFVEDELCFEEMPNLSLTLFPEGGTFSYHVKGAQIGGDIHNAGTDQNIDILALVNDIPGFFENGQGVITLKYRLGSQTIEKNVSIYKKPDTSHFTCVKGEKLFDEDCHWIGFKYQFEHKLNVEEIDTAHWSFGGEERVELDKGVEVFTRDFIINDDGLLPAFNVGLEARKGVCRDFTEKTIDDFCPKEITMKVRACEVEENGGAGVLTKISCNEPILPVHDATTGLDKYIVLQNEGPGYLEIAPDCVRALRFSGPGGLPANLNIQDLILDRCLMIDGLAQPSFLLVYNGNLISDELKESLEIDKKELLLPLGEMVQFTGTIDLNPCPTQHQFIIELWPKVQVLAPEKACFDQAAASNKISLELSPPGGKVTYKLDEGEEITLYEAAPENPILDLNALQEENQLIFEAGQLSLSLGYTWNNRESEVVEVIVTKQPDTSLFTFTKGEQILDENCEWIGFKYQFTHNLIEEEINSASAMWVFEGVEEAVDFDNGNEHAFIIREGVMPDLTVKLKAKKEECDNEDEKQITDFCPIGFPIVVNEACDIRNDDEVITAIDCVAEIEPTIIGKRREYTLNLNNGQGFVELVPFAPGGRFTITQVFPTLELDPPTPQVETEVLNNLIAKFCLGTATAPDPIYLFVYDLGLIEDDNLKAQLEALGVAQFPTYPQVVRLRVSYSFAAISSDCDANYTFDIVIPRTLPEPTPLEPNSPLTAKIRAPKATEPLSIEAAEFLNARSRSQRALLAELEKDKALANLKVFGPAKSFLILPTDDLVTVNQRFEEVIKSLTNSLSRVSRKRKTAVSRITETVLHNYLDKQMVLSPQAIDPSTKELLATHLPQLKKRKINLRTIGKSWEGEALKSALQAEAVSQFLKLLK